MLILTTDDNLDFLCESVRWCGDETFKAAPKLWTQLYTIHEQKNGYTVPCGFALLPNERKESQKYKSESDFRIRVKKLAAPAFIPVADVIPAFESLSTQFLQDELPLLEQHDA